MQEPMNEGEYELAPLSLNEITEAARVEFRELLVQLPEVETSVTENQVIVSDELIKKIADFKTKLQRAYNMHKESAQAEADKNLTALITLGDYLSTRLFNLSKNDHTLLERASGVPEMRP